MIFLIEGWKDLLFERQKIKVILKSSKSWFRQNCLKTNAIAIIKVSPSFRLYCIGLSLALATGRYPLQSGLDKAMYNQKLQLSISSTGLRVA